MLATAVFFLAQNPEMQEKAFEEIQVLTIKYQSLHITL